MKRLVPLLLIVMLALALGWELTRGPERPAPPAAPTGGDFTLQSAKGPLSLASLRGKAVLLYFGYTSCPDVCPTTLTDIGQALRQLAPAELKRVQGIFVSVDPKRDTLKHLATYTTYFHPDIVGVTGTQAEVTRVAHAYGAAFHIGKPDKNGDYSVEHTSDIYLIDPKGRLVRVLHHGVKPAAIVAALRKVLGGPG